MARGEFWTEATEAEAIKFYKLGVPASVAAHQLGGITRNTVISKWHRLRLQGRLDPKDRAVRKPKKAKPRPQEQSPFPVSLKPAPAPTIAFDFNPKPEDVARAKLPIAKTHNDLEPHHCRWPCGDVASPDFRFCGAPKMTPLLPYCADHAARAYKNLPKQNVSAGASRLEFVADELVS